MNRGDACFLASVYANGSGTAAIIEADGDAKCRFKQA
jgi:hypothetical protein